MIIRRALAQDAAELAEFNINTARETESIELIPEVAAAGVRTMIENPQMGFYLVSDGSAIPWRVRARSSCFCNLSVAPAICKGCLIADIPAVIGSLDIVLGEIDR